MVRNEREREKYSERERQRSYGKKVDKFLLVKLRGYISRKRLYRERERGKENR